MTKMLKIEEETHKMIKVLAAKEGLTMKEYVAKLVKEVSND